MKIDTSKIEGYAEMSAEEKLAALEGFDMEIPTQTDGAEVKKLKEALSRSNSEAADWKRQFREKQTESERAEAERLEKEKAITDELNSLRKDKTKSDYKAQCIAAGYTPDLAETTAQAMADGNFSQIFNDLGIFIENRTKEIEANALKSQPSITAGFAPTQKNVEDKMTIDFRKAAGLI